jgi:hypothetical protein
MDNTSKIGRFKGQPFRNIFLALTVVILAGAVAPNLVGIVQVSDLVIAGLILAALFETVRARRNVVIGLLIGMPAIFVRVVASVRPDSQAQNSLVLILSAAVIGYLIWNILHDIVGSNRSTSERIFGALCAYIFIGMLFALLYARLEFQDPNEFAFSVSSNAIVESAASESSLLPLFTYYSFVTLTTLGYGDITPVSDAARTLAWMEALIGQLYLAVMVAGFVADHISKRAAAGRNDDDSG